MVDSVAIIPHALFYVLWDGREEMLELNFCHEEFSVEMVKLLTKSNFCESVLKVLRSEGAKS